MPELSESFLTQQTSHTLLAASASSPHASESLDSDVDSPWRKWGSENLIITDTQRETAIEAAEKLFYSSPLAHHIIEQYTDFVVGEGGFELASSNREAKAILYDFWHSPVNAISRNLYYQIMEFFVYGELCYIKKDHPDGFVSVTYVPPREIDDVEEKDGVPGRPKSVTLSNEDTYEIVDWDPVTKSLSGDCFYFRMQHLGSDVRGYSRLLPLIDFLRSWETFTYNYLNKRANYDAIWWNVTLEGYTQAQIDDWLKSKRSDPPQAGSVFAHNELAQWHLVQSDFRDNNLAEDGNWYLDFLKEMGGLGSEGSTRRRVSSAGEVLDPVTRGLSTRQWEVRTCYAYMGLYVMQQAIASGRIEDSTYDVLCQAPRLGVRDFQRSSGALLRFVTAMKDAQESGWVAQDVAGQIFQDMLSRLGMVENVGAISLEREGE